MYISFIQSKQIYTHRRLRSHERTGKRTNRTQTTRSMTPIENLELMFNLCVWAILIMYSIKVFSNKNDTTMQLIWVYTCFAMILYMSITLNVLVFVWIFLVYSAIKSYRRMTRRHWITITTLGANFLRKGDIIMFGNVKGTVMKSNKNTIHVNPKP